MTFGGNEQPLGRPFLALDQGGGRPPGVPRAGRADGDRLRQPRRRRRLHRRRRHGPVGTPEADVAGTGRVPLPRTPCADYIGRPPTSAPCSDRRGSAPPLAVDHVRAATAGFGRRGAGDGSPRRKSPPEKPAQTVSPCLAERRPCRRRQPRGLPTWFATGGHGSAIAPATSGTGCTPTGVAALGAASSGDGG